MMRPYAILDAAKVANLPVTSFRIPMAPGTCGRLGPDVIENFAGGRISEIIGRQSAPNSRIAGIEELLQKLVQERGRDAG